MNIGRYRVLGEIGRGSMGVVYRAHDPNLDLEVALKVLRHDRVADEEFARRFLAEAKALGRLDHPNIVRVFNVDGDGGTVFIAMELLEGKPLDDLLRTRRFTPEEVAEMGTAVAEAVDYAHRKGIVHRDVKPSNIFVRSDGRLKITDFGIARIEDPKAQEMTQAGEILGTPAYMSPEQVLGRPVDGRSDIFSLGIILYELCAGRRPFGGESIAAVFGAITGEEPEPLSAAEPAVPPELGRIVMRCLRKDPSARYRTGGDLAGALRGVLDARRKPEAAAAAERPGRRRMLPVAAAVLILAAVGGVAVLRPGKGREAPPPPSAPAPRTAYLGVESSPAGAQVFVDGTFRGNSPLRLGLPRGKHEVKLTMAGHDDWEAQVDLAEEETPLSVTLVPKENRR